VRMIIQDEKQRALEIFEEASQDKKFVKAFGANRITRDNVFWAYIIVHSRSIWWHGERHLVPLLDLVNCGEGINEYGEVTRAHRTDFVENVAVARANKSYKKGEQVFENYAQPNYIYWAYHGFALDENSHDCIL